MGSKIQLKPASVIIADLGLNPGGRVQKYLVNTCRKHMDKYVPMDVGNLRTIVETGEDYIKYEMPYAHYQYVGHREDGSHQVKNYTTPGTGTYWDKRMWSAEKDIVIKEVQDYMDRG